MKNPITKLAIAAAVIAAVVLGLFEFISTDAGSGVVWAEVARKVETTRGVIFRGREIVSDSPDSGDDYSMHYLSGTKSRFDCYEGGQLTKTHYDDFETKTSVVIGHGRKSYIKRTVANMGDNDLWNNPKSLVRRFLSCECRELGPKTVAGILCEGIETTDPTFAGPDCPADSLAARVWVSAETRYPVRFEAKVTANNGELQFEAIIDRFQWDVELDEGVFEPNIPADYIDIWPDQ